MVGIGWISYIIKIPPLELANGGGLGLGYPGFFGAAVAKPFVMGPATGLDFGPVLVEVGEVRIAVAIEHVGLPADLPSSDQIEEPFLHDV